MQTVSLFPDLLNYGFLATGILRITLGLIFVYFAYSKIFHERLERIAFFEKLGLRPALLYFALVNGAELVAGICLTIGLYTQGAALVTGALMVLASLIKWRHPHALPYNTIEFYILLAVVSFTLIFLGPGAFAIDLPL